MKLHYRHVRSIAFHIRLKHTRDVVFFIREFKRRVKTEEFKKNLKWKSQSYDFEALTESLITDQFMSRIWDKNFVERE